MNRTEPKTLGESMDAKKMNVVMLIVAAFAVGVTTYLFANSLNVWYAVGVAVWSYNLWNQYKKVCRLIAERETHFGLTITIPRQKSSFEREESLN